MNQTTSRKDRKTKNALATELTARVPPHDTEVEKIVLGAVMLEKTAFERVSDIISVDTFYSDAHKSVFEAVTNLSKRNMPIDLHTVINELTKMDKMEMVGGIHVVLSFTNSVTSTAHLEAHARILQEKFIKREQIRIGSEMVGTGYNNEVDAFDGLDRCEKELYTLTTGHMKSDYKHPHVLVSKVIDQAESLKLNPKTLTGVPTGFRALDVVTCGWQPTDLIILAARPSVGKTAFALNLCRNATENHIKKYSVGFFSLEMSSSQLMQRILSAEAELELEKIRTGRMSDDELRRLREAGDRISQSGFLIDDGVGLNIFNLRAKARRMVSKENVGMIVIDYLQLMSGTGSRGQNREQDVSEISRNLKSLAKELEIPIIALSQLSRQIESRSTPEPKLSDLRESGAIEQDADVVAFLTRPDYQKEDGQLDDSLKNLGDLHIKKNRNGSLETIPFNTDLSIQKWFGQSQYESYKNKISMPAGNWRPIKDITEMKRNVDETPF